MQVRGVVAVLAIAVAVAWLVGGPQPAGPERMPELDQRFEPLRAQFNADAGKVRLVLLLDPT